MHSQSEITENVSVFIWEPVLAGQTESGLAKGNNHVPNNYFRSATWTPDGTSIITNSADNSIRTFIVPPDLLDKDGQPHLLSPYSIASSSEPVNSIAIPPYFSLQDASTTHVLASIRDHPIRLHNALDSSVIASYPLVNPMTEAFISPHSLVFMSGGSSFVAGSDSLISFFDTSRAGQEPVVSLSTGSRKGSKSMESGMSMRGIISALAVDEDSGVLAAGTFTRQIGLYSSLGQGECVGVFGIEGTDADHKIGGRGITQLLWSSCGRYLYIAERKSSGVMCYDIRKTGKLLSWLEGRCAMTNQRLSIDLVDNESRCDVYAGGTDGKVRQWQDPCSQEGALQPSVEWCAHEDAVSSVVVHPGDGVFATVSGQRHVENRLPDNSLRIWT